MLINNINQAQATPPIQTLLGLIRNVRNACAALDLITANAAATHYLSALRDASYISNKEHYEYSRQLADNFSSKNAELNHASH